MHHKQFRSSWLRTGLSIVALAAGLAAACSTAGLAFDSGDDQKKECPKGQVWSEQQHKCVPATTNNLFEEEQVKRGRQLARDGHYEQAIEVLKWVEATDNPIALTYLGYSYRKLGRTALGISYYRKALEIDPDNVDTREYLGEGYVASGRIDLASLQLAEIEKRCGTACEEYQSLRAVLDGTEVE
jgi:tetratricopeptide (TPR) repeat protein